MCIRDRRYATADFRDFASVLAAYLAETKATITAGCLAVAAVSYTHLRAHETVLDLVCRLLLEKKKKQKMNQQNRRYTRNTSH